MKFLKIKLGFFSLLAVFTVSVFLTSCEQEEISETMQEQPIQNVSDQMSKSAEYCDDCVKNYFFPVDVLEEGGNVSAFVEGLSETELEQYLVDETQIEERQYCGGWILDECKSLHGCYEQTGGHLPWRIYVHRNCHWGTQYSSYCWTNICWSVPFGG